MQEASPARRHLFARLTAYRQALQDPALQHPTTRLGDRDPSQLLRNGLAVVAFAVAEDFLRRRTQELLGYLPGSQPFSTLSAPLRDAAVKDVFLRARDQARRASERGDDPRNVYLEIARDVASTATVSPVLNRWSLGFSGSNLNTDEVKEMLRALGVSGGWQAMEIVTSRAKLGGISPLDVFGKIAQRRHRAAHEGTAQIPLSDLSAAADHVLAVALAYDALCSTAVRRFIAFGSIGTTDSDVALSFLYVHPRRGQRTLENEAGNVLYVQRRSHPIDALLAQAARPGVAILVGRRRIPVAWRVVQ